MTRSRQIERCAARLPADVRNAFLEALERARKYSSLATDQRFRAWDLYHQYIRPGRHSTGESAAEATGP